MFHNICKSNFRALIKMRRIRLGNQRVETTSVILRQITLPKRDLIPNATISWLDLNRNFPMQLYLPTLGWVFHSLNPRTWRQIGKHSSQHDRLPRPRASFVHCKIFLPHIRSTNSTTGVNDIISNWVHERATYYMSRKGLCIIVRSIKLDLQVMVHTCTPTLSSIHLFISLTPFT